MNLTSKLERAQARVASVYGADAVLGYDRAQPTEPKLFVFAFPDFGNDNLQAELSEMMSPTPVEIRQRLRVNQMLAQEYRNRGLGELFQPREMEDIDLGEYERLALFTPSAVASAELDNAIGDVIHANIDSLIGNHQTISAVYPCGHLFGASEAQACIWIEVRHKEITPLGDAAFPDELGGYPVCIVEGRCDPLYNTFGADDVQDKLTAGCAVAAAGRGWTTLGCFVQNFEKNVGFITTAHGGYQVGSNVYQPDEEDGHQIGRVKQSVFENRLVKTTFQTPPAHIEIGLDVSFVKLISGLEYHPRFLLPHYTQKPRNKRPINLEKISISDQPYSPVLNSQVYKLGIATAFTRATLMSTNAVCVPYERSVDSLAKNVSATEQKPANDPSQNRFVAKHQMLLVATPQDCTWNATYNMREEFADRGDSGSLCIFLQDASRADPVSLLHGRSQNTSAIFTTPIHAILQALQLELIPINSQEKYIA